MKASPFLSLVLLSSLVWLASTSSALAQYRNQFIGWEGLTKADFRLIRETAWVRMNEQPAGTILEWRNEESENWGRVKLLKIFEQDGKPCRELLYGVSFKTGSRRTIKFTLCKSGHGEWLMPG